MMNAPASTSTIKALTGMRFWAALLVVLFHYAGPGVAEGHDYLINPIISRGSIGVDLFFILSGFIIHHVYHPAFAGRIAAGDYRRFLLYRVARMYPVHVVTMALMFALYAVATLVFHKTPQDAQSYGAAATLANLLMVHAWLGYGSPNVPAWSISAEWFMYLLYPLLALALARCGRTIHWALALAALMAVATVSSLHPILHIVPEFILGSVLYCLNRHYGFSTRFSPYSGLISVVCFVATNFAGVDRTVAYAVIFALLILSLTNEKDILARWLSHKYCIYPGDISYSLYMIHSFVWSVIKNAARQLAPSFDFYTNYSIILSVLISVISAALVYHTIEVSGRRLIRRLAET